ncbi:hypothetical protein N7454_004684 [Penicillium verhagenii]|nr:hypothetical protein N7454_004684 [Penicillium verhagenii]
MSTPNPRGRRSLRNSGVGTHTPSGDTKLTGLQRLPSHTRYPLTPSRLVTAATPSAQRSGSRYTPRARAAGAPATPYGLRARQQRATNTPGRDRRRKRLRRSPHPIQSSPQEIPEPIEEPKDEIEELDNEPRIDPPRLSLPIQESEDESEEAGTETPPPRMSLAFDDDDITYRSVEYPRDLAIRDRLSIMPGRPSENFGGIQLESDSDDGDETGIVGDYDVQDDTMVSGGDFDRGGETEDLGRFHFDLDFPSPPPAPIDDPEDDNLGDMEGFELSAPDFQPIARSVSSDDDAGGDFMGFDGFDVVHPASRSQSPGMIGGGLRDEAMTVPSKEKKLSRHGIPVPNLPTAAMAAIEQASSWFFEQASTDLAGYSKHAGRKTIDESDVAMLMRRQRQTNSSTTMFSLAQKYLPKELQQDMRLAMPP